MLIDKITPLPSSTRYIQTLIKHLVTWKSSSKRKTCSPGCLLRLHFPRPLSPSQPISSQKLSPWCHLSPQKSPREHLSGQKRGWQRRSKITKRLGIRKQPIRLAASKRVRFKVTVDASTKQVLDAMQKITAHIGNPSKFSKASKLALQLVHAGSVNAETCDHFFQILQAAMSSPSSCTDPGLRADYHTFFSAVQDLINCFNKQQQKQLETWIIRAQVANDLFTDDSFIFSKASARLRQAISSLPEVSQEEDILEEKLVSSREDENGHVEKAKDIADEAFQGSENHLVIQVPSTTEELETDPFGLDALLPKQSKKDERARKKKEEAASNKKALDDAGKILREHREALMQCVAIAAGRYRVPWAQTMIDILVKHAFDSISRFTARQRDVIEKLWASIREQQMRRRQGKSATGKLDVTAFERLQEQYANEKISIRHGVGDGGERRAQQWLG